MDNDQEPRSEEGGNGGVISYSTSETSLSPVSTAIPPQGPDGSITWTASEFIQHQKGPIWYVVLFVVTFIIAFLFWLLTKDLMTAAVIVLAMVILAIWAAKKPREIEYRIDKDGLHIADKTYPFVEFKSFAIDRHGAFSSLVFLPLKRFSLLTTVYYDPADESKITDIVSQYLPIQEKSRDIIDELMWKIRF